MKAISFDESKKIQLEMLDEIDIFCRKHSIRYSLAFGTLLGAVRHKGFIPWDDDVDIMMPLPDLLKFKEMFKSDKLQYCDVDNTPGYEFHFSRIAHKDTIQKKGKKFCTYGVCIDLYIMVNVPDDAKEQDTYFSKANKLFAIRKILRRLNNKLHKAFPLTFVFPFFQQTVRACRNHFFSLKYNSTEAYYILAAPLSKRRKTSYNFNLFNEMCQLSFEGKRYNAISNWDLFLSQMYGDYMQLPPEDQRHPYHGFKYYWK